MSRIGKAPVPLPTGVSVRVDGARVIVKGPKGELEWTRPARITVEAAANEVRVGREGDDAAARALHGTARSLIAGMVRGVEQGYRKELEIEGVGYKAALQGQELVLNLGFSHAVRFPVPKTIRVEVADATKLAVSGPDKRLVGEVAARIRGFAKAEPYKGKGVRYKGEHIRRKAGKTVA